MNTNSLKSTYDEAFSEVIFSTPEVITAQCYKEQPQALKRTQNINQGSGVKVVSSYDTSYAAFGIIVKINNSSLDNIHRPQALGLSVKELEQLHPQLYELLKKELEIYLFAYKEKGSQILNYPPTKPMMIHDRVYFLNEGELIKLTEDFSSLINLIKKNQLKADILFNLINTGYRLRDYNYEYLLKTGQMLTLAFSDEVELLMPLLRRLSESRKEINVTT